MLEPYPLSWFDVVLRVAVPNVAARFQFLDAASAVVTAYQSPGFRFASWTPIAPPATASSPTEANKQARAFRNCFKVFHPM